VAGASPPGARMPDQKKPDNVKTALILFTIALAFFVGFFVKHLWFN
jgi:hypothetical protein